MSWLLIRRLLLAFLLTTGLVLLPGACVPVNREFRSQPGGIKVFVVSNGFHTDVLLPRREACTGTDWLQFLANPSWASQFGGYQYVAFGWGNEGFYLASYQGQRPGLGTILQALVPSPTLMHVDFYRAAPRLGSRVVALQLSEAQYQQLTTYVQASFARDSTGALMPRNAASYTPDDFFFRAQGRYHALRTCNDWTNQALSQAGIRAAWKAPLAAQVLFQVRRAQ